LSGFSSVRNDTVTYTTRTRRGTRTQRQQRPRIYQGSTVPLPGAARTSGRFCTIEHCVWRSPQRDHTGEADLDVMLDVACICGTSENARNAHARIDPLLGRMRRLAMADVMMTHATPRWFAE